MARWIDKLFPPKDGAGQAAPSADQAAPSPTSGESFGGKAKRLVNRVFPQAGTSPEEAPTEVVAETKPVEPKPTETVTETKTTQVVTETAPVPPLEPGAERPFWRKPLVAAGAVLLIAGVALAFAYDDLVGDSENEAASTSPVAATPPPLPTMTTTEPVTPVTGEPPVPTTTSTVPEEPEQREELLPPTSKEDLTSWPSGKSGWTVVLASATTRAAARRTAERATARGLEAGVLESRRYSSLKPGFFVAFAGRYERQSEARDAIGKAADEGFSGAYARFIEP